MPQKKALGYLMLFTKYPVYLDQVGIKTIGQYPYITAGNFLWLNKKRDGQIS